MAYSYSDITFLENPFSFSDALKTSLEPLRTIFPWCPLGLHVCSGQCPFNQEKCLRRCGTEESKAEGYLVVIVSIIRLKPSDIYQKKDLSEGFRHFWGNIFIVNIDNWSNYPESPNEEEIFTEEVIGPDLFSHSSAKTIEKNIDLALLSRFEC